MVGEPRPEWAHCGVFPSFNDTVLSLFACIIISFSGCRAAFSCNRKCLAFLLFPSSPSLTSTNQQLRSPTTHCPPSPDGDGRGVGQINPKPKGGRRRKRERATSSSGDVRHTQRATPSGGAAVPILSSVALVPVHTIESAAEVVAARRRRPVVSESAAELASSPVHSDVVGGARRSVSENSTSRPRPRTSTGCERRVTSKAAIGMPPAKRGDRNARRKEVGSFLLIVSNSFVFRNRPEPRRSKTLHNFTQAAHCCCSPIPSTRPPDSSPVSGRTQYPERLHQDGS